MKNKSKRSAAVVIDAVLGLLAPFLIRGKASGVPPQPRVLLIRCDHLGDAAMATAVIGPLREALAASRFDVLAAPWSAPLFQHHPSVDGVITVATPWWLVARGSPRVSRLKAWLALPKVIGQIRAGRYDVGIDLRGDLRQILFFLVLGRCSERVSSDRTGGKRLLTRTVRYCDTKHEVEKNLAVATLLGVSGKVYLEPPRLPGLPPAVEELLRSSGGREGYITLSVRGTKRNRTWPAYHAAKLVEDAASTLGLRTVYIGGEDDREVAEEIANASSVPMAILAGRLSLMQSLAVIAKAKAAVAVDSGPMHLAAMVGTPVVALFGPADPVKYRPWASRTEIVTLRAPCGCVDPDCRFTATGSGTCMAELTPPMVMSALSRVLGSPAPSARTHMAGSQ